MVATLRWLLCTHFFSQILLMIFCIPGIVIMGNFSTQLNEFNSLRFKLTSSRKLIIVLFWSPFVSPLFFSTCLYQQ